MNHSIRSSHQYLENAESLPIRKKNGWIVRLSKILWLGFWLGFNTFLVAGPIALSVLVTSSGKIAFQFTRLWAWLLLKMTRVRIQVTGKAHLQKNQSYIIIANHSSHYDGPALALGLGIQFRWIAKKELLRFPLFGDCLHASGNIFIDRSNRENAIESINEGVRRLPQGTSVMCFAEGTRSASGQLGAFKKGGFAAAVDHGLPILPVAVMGSSQVLPKGSLTFTPGAITVAIGTPIPTKTSSMNDIETLMDQTRDAIQAGMKSAGGD
jgi:1-acyl-sn-glycerol-3-phosphate acyltransferase